MQMPGSHTRTSVKTAPKRNKDRMHIRRSEVCSRAGPENRNESLVPDRDSGFIMYPHPVEPPALDSLSQQ